jgi:hypothetical protein
MTSDEYRDLVTFLGQRFEQIDARFEQIDARFDQVDARIDSVRRELGTMIENTQAEIRVVSEGVATANRRIDGLTLEIDRQFRDLRSDIDLRYRELDRRVTRLEQDRPR